MKNDFILFTIGRINNKVNRFLDQELKKNGLGEISVSHGEIIALLMRKQPLKMKEIAVLIDKDKSTITALVNKLIDLGFVEKKMDEIDSRISLISLTKKGEALIPAYIGISEKLAIKAFSGISKQEKEILNILLEKLNKGM